MTSDARSEPEVVRRRSLRRAVALAVAVAVTGLIAPATLASADVLPAEGTHFPEPPKPEPVKIEELPLPPTAPSADTGSCTRAVNPHRTGCIDPGSEALQSGGFLPDGHTVSAAITFAGAPDAPDPASVYRGAQVIIVKTDDTKFANGDAWKCITCGVPPENSVGLSGGSPVSAPWDYPQPFRDGRRVLAGTSIIQCASPLLSARCTPERTHIYPIRWRNKVDDSGSGGNMRELRLHPDNIHLGFNHINFEPVLGQVAYLGRLKFSRSPDTGEPQAPRYDLVDTIGLYNTTPRLQPWEVDPAHPDQLRFNPLTPQVGELRGFSKDGKEVLYIGNPAESDNVDVFATDLATGKTRRVTRNPDYTDPVDASPDGKWLVAMDSRAVGRELFLAAMQNVPPLTDMVTVAFVSSVRNNGDRRFFQPYLIDRYGDRGSYQGQRLNAGGRKPGSVSDPNWNGRADPRWSPDGTAVVYWQSLVTAPRCGGANPLPCPTSSEPGGRRTRMMIARLTSWTPIEPRHVPPLDVNIPWGTPYVPGSNDFLRPHLPSGTYTLRGQKSGDATVEITEDAAHLAVTAVSVTYDDYSDDGVHIIKGTESVSGGGSLVQSVEWHSNLVLSGRHHGTKVTSEPGGFVATIDLQTPVLQATGTITTTIDGKTYRQPANGT